MKKKRVRDKCVLRIVRQIAGGDSHLQSFSYEIRSKEDTVATALRARQSDPDLRDIEGNAATPPVWECGCLQKKCGACAMLVNGDPALACGSRLCDLPERITLAPLKKFPVVQADPQLLRQHLSDLCAARSACSCDADRYMFFIHGNTPFFCRKKYPDAFITGPDKPCGSSHPA